MDILPWFMGHPCIEQKGKSVFSILLIVQHLCKGWYKLLHLGHLVDDLDKINSRWAMADASAAPCAEVDAVSFFEIVELVVNSMLESLFPLFAEHKIPGNFGKAFDLAAAEGFYFCDCSWCAENWLICQFKAVAAWA